MSFMSFGGEQADKVHATFWCFAAVDGGYLAR